MKRKVPVEQQEDHSPGLQFSHEEFLISEEVSLEKGRILSKLLNDLPPGQKEVIHLRFYNGLSFKEIASILEISPKTAKNQAYLALKKMQINKSL